MTIYEYFGYPKKIVDMTFEGMTYRPLKDNFKKRWGENLENDEDSLIFTKQDYSDFSNYFEKIFKNNLELVLEYINMEYSEDEIILSLKRKERLKKRLPRYDSVKEMCSILGVKEEKLIKLLSSMPKNQALCFCYYYGINYPKTDINSISKIFNLEIKKVALYIYNIHNNILKELKLDKKILRSNIILEEKEIFLRRKNNYLDYFDKEDRNNVLMLLKLEKKQNTSKYQALMKIYDENYILKEKPKRLSPKEYKDISYLKNIISDKLKKLKNGENINSGRKECFLDYFSEEDKEFVLEILSKEKKQNTKKYQTLRKIYDENYILKAKIDKLESQEYNDIYALKKKIKMNLEKIKNNTSLENNRCKSRRKECFLDYFSEEDKKFVLEFLKLEKEKDTKRYQALRKVYDENYMIKNFSDKMTQIEQSSLFNLRKAIEKSLEQMKNQVETEIQNNLKIYDMDKYYLENLDQFKENYQLILLTILKHGNITVKEIIENTDLKNHMLLMSDMEQAHFYLKLKSYQDSSLTDDKIEKILDLTKQDLQEYEISGKSKVFNKNN